jgi:ataxia telangiectasia mutated family protein
VSGFLERDPKTRVRHMRLRTYIVQPLTSTAGLIEFVENTTSMGAYLLGGASVEAGGRGFEHSAHARHNKGDLSFEQAIRLVEKNHAERDPAKRLRGFREVCGKFRPAFRHFFFEKFLVRGPAEYLARRSAYTRSTAANSMVGMVLGIGDRHTQNIMLDVRTGEVVHIDFGVAFEQGKVLAVPETVPYRLTRDVVDGFGVTGVAGAFARACEETLSVLRENAEAILTICEVFMHDPLHNWTLTADKARALERRGAGEAAGNAAPAASDSASTKGEDNKSASSLAAHRALFRVRQNLQGACEDSGDLLDVPSQVKRSIYEATSETNLADMFFGWAAFV